MQFDPTSAQPVQSQGFDPTSAQPVGQSSFDPTSATLAPQPKESLDNIARGLHGAYMDSVTHGLLFQPVRAAMEGFGYGMDRVKQLYPGQSDDFYKAKLHDIYNQAVDNARTQAHQEVVNNPYPGHQVGNFAANVLGSADPTWLVAPGGGGVTKSLFKDGVVKAIPKVAGVVGKNAAVQSGLGSVSNTAAQAMDIAEGQKKDFDISENLQSAAFGGAFGAAHAGVLHPLGEAVQPVVSDFVKGLYKNRGVDTTPNANPAGNRTPMTGNSVSMSPEEQTQFKQLLKTGDVDAIKGFLADKQGPKPTYQDVNNLVQFRDSLPDNFVGQDALKSAIDSHMDDLHKQVVQNHIDTVTQDWKNKPDIELINHVDEIQDPKVREQAVKDGAQENGLGFVGEDGKVRIFANRMATPDLLNTTLYHEALGHYGLQQKFGDRLDSTLQSMMDRNVGNFNKEVDLWQKKNPGAYNGDRVRAAEEVLAEKSQNGQMKTPWSDAVSGVLRAFGRKMGLKLSYSDAEIEHILAMAHNSVVNGKGRDVIGNMFKGATPKPDSTSQWLNISGPEPEHGNTNRYMFTGPKAKNYRAEHPTQFMANDGIMRNEISDARASLHPGMEEGNTYRLGDVLDHQGLYNEYPHLKDTKVDFKNMDDEGLHGSYDPTTDTIGLNSRSDPSTHLSTVLHETQHAIQSHEGYAGVHDGGTLHLSPEEYKSHPLEKEAYETEARKDMSPVNRVYNEPNKFLTKQQLAASADYQIKNMEKAYEATDKDYVPEYRSNAEVTRDALDQGFSPSDIKRMGSLPDLAKRNARMTFAAKVLDQRISDLEDKMLSRQGTPELYDQYRQAIADHSYILQKIRGDRAEIARAQQISKLGYTRTIMESYGELLKEHGGLMAGLGDDETLLKFARQMKLIRSGGANPAGMNTMVSALTKPNWEDYITELHASFMLSGLSTHVKAPTDMIIGIGREALNSTTALVHTAAVSALNAIPGVDLKPGVHPVEASMRLWGLMKAALDANTTIGNSINSFTNPGLGPNYGGKQGVRIPVVSKVKDLITAQDTFFRAFATNMHLYGLASREAVALARATGGKMDFDTLVNQASARARQPSSSLLKEAREAADKTLLLNKNPITEPLDRFKQTTPNSSNLRRAGAFIANFLTPFVRVESNSLYNRLIRNSPLTLLDPQTYKELASGGETQGIALARVFFALAPVPAMWAAAGAGKLTAQGPDSPQKRAELEASGWRPDAVHENGQYNTGNKLASSLNPWDVHNSTASMIADVREAYDAGANQGQVLTGLKLAGLSLLKRTAGSSWINDVAPLVDAFTASNATIQDKMAKFAGGEAATLVPNLVGQAARVTDQNQPQTIVHNNMLGTMASQVMAALPGARQTLPTQETPYGDPVQGGASGFGQHTDAPQDNRLTGGNHVDETHDPAERELARLGAAYDDTLVTPVNKNITINGEKRRLDDREVETYQRMAGREIVETMRDKMNTPEWNQMSDEDKANWVKDMQKDRKAAVKEYLYGE